MEDVPETMQLCLNTECSSRFCETCIASFATEAVSRALYAVPWLHCPGCRARLPTQSWGLYAPEALEKYKFNAQALFSFRCSECHEPSSLYQEYSAKAKAVDSFLDSKNAKQLTDAWMPFAFAESNAESLLDLIPEPEQVDQLLPSIVDCERRACLHLAFLRRNPFIQTPCCDVAFCFKCKVGSHHEGQTCEERQLEELDIHVQFCPECEVPTVRTEGCDHIACVCGADWTWQKHCQVAYALGPSKYLREMLISGELDPNWVEDALGPEATGGKKSLLMFTVGAGRLENSKILIEAGADVHAHDGSDKCPLLYALGVNPQMSAYHEDCVNLLVENGAQLSLHHPFVWMHSALDSVPAFKRLMDLSSKIDEFSVDKKHNEESLLRVALLRGRIALAKELIENFNARVDLVAPYWFVQGGLSDLNCFDLILSKSGLGINDTDPETGHNVVQLAMSKNKKDLVRHLILKHNASATFRDVAKPIGYWPDYTPIPEDLFDALVSQGANVWESIPTPGKNLTSDENRGWLLSQVLACNDFRGHRNFKGDSLLGRMLALWNHEADLFAQTASGAALVVKAVRLAAERAKTASTSTMPQAKAKALPSRHGVLAMNAAAASSSSSNGSREEGVREGGTTEPPKASPWCLAKRLIEAGANCTATDDQGRTPLFFVVSSVEKSVAQLELLIKTGADVLTCNKSGETASNMARKNSWDEGVQLLEVVEKAQRAAAEEAAWKAGQSGDGTLSNVGLRVGGAVKCAECSQRFDSEQIREVHRLFMHDPSRRQED
jgi:hypothetical protein